MTNYEDTINAAHPSATVGEVCIRLNGIGEGGPYPVVNGVCVLPQSVAENLVASAVGQQVKRELLAQWASYKQSAPQQPAGVDEDAAEALRFLLTRIGSWTNARWDQHLRHEFGDDRAGRMITALAAQQQGGAK